MPNVKYACFADAETYYEPKGEYSLSKMPTMSYIRSPKFHLYGIALAVPGLISPGWYTGRALTDALALIPWDETELICHNTSFDGAVLTQQFGHTPAYYTCTMLRMRWAIAQGVLPPSSSTRLAEWIDKGDTAQATQDGGDELERYAMQDLKGLIVAYQQSQQWHMPKRELDLIDLHVRMAVEPVLHLNKQLLAEVANRTPPEAAIKLRKQKTFVAALQACGVEPETKTSARTGKPIYAFAKTDAFMQTLAHHPDPRVRTLHELRTTGGSNINRTRAQRFLNVGEPLPVPLLYYGAHTARASGQDKMNCFSAGHELLTPSGWVKVEDCQPGVPLMQWWPDKALTYDTNPGWMEKPFTGEMVNVEGPMVSMRVTEDHRLVSMREGRVIERTAGWVASHSGLDGIPVSGRYTHGASPITPAQARLLVALAADGSIQKGAATWGVRKQRKIKRLPQLLADAGVPYSTTHNGKTTYYRVKATDRPAWLRKGLGYWMLHQTPDSAAALLKELPLWDGWTHGDGKHKCFCTAQRKEADWVVTLSRLHGAPATLYRYESNTRTGEVFHVYFRSSQFTSIDTKRQVKTEFVEKETVYCPSVESGWVLVRRNGHIFVVGQCQNLPRGGELRRALQAPPGHKLVIVDSSQIEVRVLAWLADEPQLLATFAEGRDPYIAFAAEVMFNKPHDEVTKEERRIAKSPVLACGYGLSRFGLIGYAHGMGVDLSEQQADAAVQKYRAAYPAIRRYGEAKTKEIAQQGFVKLPSGRKQVYPSRWWEGRELHFLRPNIFSKAQKYKRDNAKLWWGATNENLCQSTARDLVMWQTLLLAKKYRVVTSVHDECVICVPEAQAEQAKQDALEAFASNPPWMQDLPVAGEAVISDDYGEKP